MIVRWECEASNANWCCLGSEIESIQASLNAEARASVMLFESDAIRCGANQWQSESHVVFVTVIVKGNVISISRSSVRVCFACRIVVCGVLSFLVSMF